MTTTTAPDRTRHDPRLRRLMTADTVLTGLNTVAYLALAPWLADLFGPPAAVFVGLGLFLVAVTGWLVDIVRRPVLDVTRIRIQAGVNAVWVLASVVLLWAATDLTALGRGWDVLQALVVAGFAFFQVHWSRTAR